MKVEKIYSQGITENSEKMIESYDMAIIESLVDRYGSEEIINQLNEYGYYNNTWDSKTGGGSPKVKGIGAVLQSLPSLAITTAIAWPVALFAGIGALTHRIQQRWENKEAWRNRLLPGFWVDALADPADKNVSYAHKVATAPVHLSKKALALLGIGAAGKAGYDAAKKKGFVDKIKNAFKQKTGKDMDKASSEDVKRFIDTSTGEMMPFKPEEIKSMDFKEFYVYLTNGEIIRVLADTKENAKQIAQYIIDTLSTKKVYQKMNELVKSGRCQRYIIPFDDGEIAIISAESEQDAIKSSLQQRDSLCKAINGGSKGLIFIDPLTRPKPLVEDIETDTNEIQTPRIKTISEQKPKINRVADKKLPNPLYKTQSMLHYYSNFAEFRFNYPAGNDTGAEQILLYILRDAKQTLEEIYKNYQQRQPLFRVSLGDGDIYNIACESEYKAKEFAIKLHDLKIKIYTEAAPREGKVEISNLLKLFGTRIKAINDIKQIQLPKKHNFKEDWVRATIKEKFGKAEKDVYVKKQIKVN